MSLNNAELPFRDSMTVKRELDAAMYKRDWDAAERLWREYSAIRESEKQQSKDSPPWADLGRVHISTEAERQYREAGEPVGPGIWHEGFKRGFTYALSLRDSAEQAKDSGLHSRVAAMRDHLRRMQENAPVLDRKAEYEHYAGWLDNVLNDEESKG